MAAATCKSDLLSVTHSEFKALTTLLDTVPASQQLTPDPGAEGTTPKDIIAHRAHWIELFLGWYHDGQAGKHPAIPAPGYKWNMLKAYNTQLRHNQRDLTWDQARTLLEENHTLLLNLIEGLSDAKLYGAPMQGGNSKWATGRWAEAAGPSHYRSARKYLRRRLNQLKSI